MEKKKGCSFCKRTRKKMPMWILGSLYILVLAIWGQIELIKLIIKLLHL
jgi:hypothetical protein